MHAGKSLDCPEGTVLKNINIEGQSDKIFTGNKKQFTGKWKKRSILVLK